MRILCLLCLCLAFCANQKTWAQARMVLNGAKINLINGGKLVLANGSPNALVRHSGHIISEGQSNEVHWKIGAETGAYLVPWGLGAEAYLPLSFTKGGEVSAGTFVFSTYGTGWQNSLHLPEGVTDMDYKGQDNSAFAVDRFWQVNTQDYLRPPSLSNVSFGYLDQEHIEPNMIIEHSLQAQRWDDDRQTWATYAPQGQADFSSNSVFLESIGSTEMETWWTMADASTALPLHFLSFTVTYQQQVVRLAWQTTDEVNVKEFEIQRSQDLFRFSTVGRQKAKGGNGSHLYAGTDHTAVPGVAYYRIKAIDFDGKVTYSALKSITLPSQGVPCVFPNPLRNRNSGLNAAQFPPGNYTLTLLDTNGRIIRSEVREFRRNMEAISLPPALPPGLYIMKISGCAFQHVEKLMVE